MAQIDVIKPIALQLSKGETNMYPQVSLYKSDGTFVATYDMSHVANGLYITQAWTPDSEEYYYAVKITYTDAGHSNVSTRYGRCTEEIRAETIEVTVTYNQTHIDNIESDVSTIDGKIDTAQTDITFIKDIEGGRWIRDGTQMIFYKADGVTEVARFNLKDKNGNLAGETKNIFERERV